MRGLIIALLSASVTLLAAAGVAHATDQSRFDSLIGRSAPGPQDVALGADKFSPKAACVCQEGAYANWPGVLIRFDGFPGLVYCQVVTFNTSGDLAASGYCGSFVVLPK